MSADAPAPALRRVLLSAWDKTGLVDFARALHAEFGSDLLSTGGTAAVLAAAGLPVTLIETLTRQPEMLDGRVKTLHPAIHAGLLADRSNPDHLRQLVNAGFEPIDAVVVDLYPFESVTADPACDLARAIEMIDIGGVALLRAAAKNHEHVLVLSAPADRDELLGLLRDPAQVAAAGGWGAVRRRWAIRTFDRVSRYDATISDYLRRIGTIDEPAPRGTWELRYGENPHQSARVEENRESLESKTLAPSLTAGVALAAARGYQPADAVSYNNLLDADAALELCDDLARAFAVSSVSCFIKHSNACGVGVAPPGAGAPISSIGVGTPANPSGLVAADREIARESAYRRAYLGDPNAAMGGVLAVNHEVDAGFARLVMETFPRYGRPLRDAGAAHAPGAFFLEVWVAPSFTEEAVTLIRGNTAPAGGGPTRSDALPARPPGGWGERVRLLPVGPMGAPRGDSPAGVSPQNATAARGDSAERRRDIAGGSLWQSVDALGTDPAGWRVVTRRAPTDQEWLDLRVAWLVCKHTRSNAISIVRDAALLGNGAGQMSRVMSCRLAVWLARENGHHDALAGAVAASDAFFPFSDGPRVLIEAGVRAIIQPGGSKRDADTLAMCDDAGVTMIFTSERHFRH
ncbi:MAG: bifunctional phosphoribosylaminoimidazolecarboxamide formyltransferase/IMP cyclohydrolase [Planctomycetia bacterium]|nr:MAG: bifunctional phosphoribosylaminoimidazolecarboxamide formyltransferase/IMP cyclohydrolase [Planctomycetia bacterium]